MKRVGIITIIDYSNYGNRLQNYATQETLRALGFEAHTILNSPPSKSFIQRVNSFQKKDFKDQVQIIRRKLKSIGGKQELGELQEREFLRNKRMKNFKEFSNEYILETEFVVDNGNVPENLGELCDYFVTGSDQVWNPNFRGGSSFDFLTFAAKEKRVAFAASFGIDNIPKKYKNNYKFWLSDFAHISVREDFGADIVKKLTGRDVEVLVDPTMLLDKETWRSIIISSETKPSKPFLLTYFLGKMSSEVCECISSIAVEYGLEIVNLNDFDDPARYTISPNEFLDYIDSSEIIFTDSFHGAVFSLLFERPLVVCDRISAHSPMSSRINTLFSKFSLDHCTFSSRSHNRDWLNNNYEHVKPILLVEREKSISYLKVALNID